MPNRAKCSHIGLLPLNLHKSGAYEHCPILHWDARSTETCSESPSQELAKVQAQVSLTPWQPPAWGRTLSPGEGLVCRVGLGWPSVFAFPALLLPCRQHLADCLPKDLPTRKGGGPGGGAVANEWATASGI